MFEKPFWVGIFERVENGKLSVAKVTFGAEPKDCEVYEYILKRYYDLKFSPIVDVKLKDKKQNPKKIRREIKKSLQSTGIGTKSQQALKLQQEQNKLKRKSKSREQREIEAKRQFELRRQKKKDKHKGR